MKTSALLPFPPASPTPWNLEGPTVCDGPGERPGYHSGQVEEAPADLWHCGALGASIFVENSVVGPMALSLLLPFNLSSCWKDVVTDEADHEQVNPMLPELGVESPEQEALSLGATMSFRVQPVRGWEDSASLSPFLTPTE